jgi:hypothetical protein
MLKKKREEYIQNNREKYLESKRKERIKNIKKYTIRHKIYWQNNKERLKKLNNIWIKNNYERYRKYMNNRHKLLMKTDSSYKIKKNLRRRLNLALKEQGIIKDKSFINYIGCNIKYLLNYIECQFSDTMSWSNYGKWHIDHIVPCSNFDLTKESEKKRCFNYNNLRPLWAKDNLSKGAKIL